MMTPSSRQLLGCVVAALMTFGTDAAVAPLVPEAPKAATVDISKHLLARLCTTPPVHIELSYQGALTEFSGQICYHFAGYNESCIELDARWLTPATVIHLIAPGQVPAELLANYTLLVRLPSQSEQTYKYALEPARCLIEN